jgi:hypothetical protein
MPARWPKGTLCALLATIAVATSSAPSVAQLRASTAPRTRPKPLSQALPPEAKGDYDAGKILFEDGDFQTSRIKFQAAYDLTHDARLLWNVAVCQKNERHYAKALATLSRYLRDGGDLLSPSDRNDAEELSKAITPFTSAATFRVSEDGAQLWVDDERLGITPITQPVAIDLGPRKVRAKKDGFRVFEEEVAVGGNATVTIDVRMERQSGHLDLRVPSNATVSIDGNAVGTGPSVDIDLPVGGHELLVTAPGMRPYQGDLVIEDARTRAFDITLEHAPDPTSEVDVAVGCGHPDPGSPEDGLAVFFDDAKESSPALGTRRKSGRGREEVAYVPYAVTPGRHTARVALAGCDPEDTVVEAPLGGHASITGMLPSSHLSFDGSPAGSPDGLVFGAGVTTIAQSFSSYGAFFRPGAGATAQTSAFGMTMIGGTLTGGLEGRWLSLLGDVRFVRGTTGNVGLTGTDLPAGATGDSSLSILTVGIRPGVRLPLFFGALSAGVAVDSGLYLFSPSNLGTSRSNAFFDVGLWAAVDVKPVCDWGLQGGTEVAANSYGASSVGEGAATTFWLHVVYEPNVVCQRARDGAFKIEGTVH